MHTYKLPELMNQVGGDSGSRSTKRMPNCNRTTVHIAFLWVQSESFGYSQILRGKSLIHLSTENKECQEFNYILCGNITTAKPLLT